MAFFIDGTSLYCLIVIPKIVLRQIYSSICQPAFTWNTFLSSDNFLPLQVCCNVWRRQPRFFWMCPTHSNLFIIKVSPIRFALHNLLKWAGVTISYIVIISEFIVVYWPVKYFDSSSWLYRASWTFIIYRTIMLCLPFWGPFLFVPDLAYSVTWVVINFVIHPIYCSYNTI